MLINSTKLGSSILSVSYEIAVGYELDRGKLLDHRMSRQFVEKVGGRDRSYGKGERRALPNSQRTRLFRARDLAAIDFWAAPT